MQLAKFLKPKIIHTPGKNLSAADLLSILLKTNYKSINSNKNTIHLILISQDYRLSFDEETIKLTSFSSGDKLFTFLRGFYGLKGLPNFFTKQMSSFFETLIEQGFALVYIDDIYSYQILKNTCFNLLNNYILLAQKKNFKLAPEKSFLCSSKSSFWDMK